MTRSGMPRSFILLVVLGAACSNGKPFVPTDGGSGGRVGSGGRGGAGGSVSTGGAGGTGGGIDVETGGAGPGGSPAGSGGQVGTGGGGGSVGAGGTAGVVGSGGRASGGAGGTAGAGGTTSTCTATGKHSCAGVCVDNSSPATCGSRCEACTAPAGGTATCDGTNCGFTCGGSTPKQCLTAGICIPSTGCCASTDCPTNAGGQTGTCDSGTHMCNYSCTGSTKSCTAGSTTVCIPTTACCTNSDCPGNCMMCNTTTRACTAVKGLDDPNGRCAGTCDANGACKAKQGQTCSAASDCITNNCADTVCCNTACGGACEYCNGTVPGTCGFVSGVPRTGHPACGGSASCAGTCDGTKATCKMPGTETSCRAMMCSAGTMTNPAVCDGAGNCPAVTTSPCGAYACNGTMSCYTTCTAPSQCAANSICSGNQCAKCPAGQTVCSNGCYDTNNDAGHCGASCMVCAGSTPSCASGACTCRIKNNENIVLNPGFNGSTSSWTVQTAAYSTTDVEGCTGSGSLNMGDSGHLNQCLTAGFTPGLGYGFGFRYRSTNNGSIYCEVSYFMLADCSTGYMGRATITLPSDGTSWVPGTISGNLPLGTGSVGIHCSGAIGTGYLDQFYLSHASSPGF